MFGLIKKVFFALLSFSGSITSAVNVPNQKNAYLYIVNYALLDQLLLI